MKASVPVFRNMLKSVTVETAATIGAQVGVNLLLPDGTVGTIAQLQKLFGSTPSTGTTINTTDDVAEGQWNLYFTNRRAQDAVGAILANSANVTLTYVGGTSITADLTTLTDSGAGALLAITRDAKGRISGTRAATITGTAGRITVANGDASVGLPTIDLATVADAGGGTLQRFVRDAWGRITGTSAATTSDLAEGTNLYFTAARVLATILAGLSTTTNAVITAADTVLTALGKLQAQITGNAAIPAGYIDGLKMVWNSATSISATSGTCYIQGSSAVISFPATLTLSSLSLTASTFYHLYGYLNAGTPAIELVTTAPAAAYSGTARSKTGDTSRRYLGSVLTDGSGNVILFQHDWVTGFISYVSAAATMTTLAAGAALVSTTVSQASVVPITANFVHARYTNNSTTSCSFYLGRGDQTVSSTSGFNVQIPFGNISFMGLVPLDASQRVAYIFNTAPSAGAGGYIIVNGYAFER